MNKQTFAQRLSRWQQQHGRHHLPWQSQNPYHVWLSEIMLQQTQVSTVLDYYPRFLSALPNVAALAHADEDTVLALWSGLGYYSRARNLHHSAKQILDHHNGEFPADRQSLEQLKGIGRSTAAAICVFAFGQREAILDGNVKRLLIRHHAIDSHSADRATIKQLWTLAESLLPHGSAKLRRYTQGLMDLGSLICTRSQPSCHACPVQNDCQAHAQGLSNQLPRKKPRKTKPEKTTVMLIMRQRQQLHLERRPDQGIWRSLWSFPEFTQKILAKAHAATIGTIQSCQTLNPIKHSFTHYNLTITPLLIELTPKPTSHLPFLTPAEALTKGLPKPVRDLIESL